MNDFHINTTLRDKSYNYSNVSLNNDDSTNNTYYNYDNSTNETLELIENVVDWIVICSGLPLTLVAIATVYSLVRKDHVAPIYIINLLVSDLVQLCCLAVQKAEIFSVFILCFYIFGLLASVGFMMCISLERYLMITQPLWYRFRRNIKTSVAVCVVVWILSFIISISFYFHIHDHIGTTISAIFLLPFPLFIFCLVGTIKALSAARSVPADEKQRIVAILVVVLLIYTLLFLPSIIFFLAEKARYNQTFFIICFILVKISPLADLILYIFIRKGTTDKLLALLCCCKMSTNQQTSNRSNDMSASCSQTI
ncbi:mas-related G-protein coupled receptor member A6-like [Melanotaenia boesemani]|uniref:mas-related G-protein coupled receptor member A6-like n=1 Tax=Melanotaenia boesemani TaxID=1250792 RepID=UPI001C05D481|nr:mas-related G-protein coupled receptor member A6-like [Melanotaenia boesemani]